MRMATMAAFCVAAMLCSDQLRAATWQTRVESVIEGDTIGVTNPANLKVRVKLIGIDAPESNQPYADESRRALSDKILGEKVVLTFEPPRSKNAVIHARVAFGERWINLEMVKEGWAWAVPSHAGNPELKEAQQIASKARVGLWQADAPVSPWEWRRSGRAEAQVDNIGMIKKSGTETNADAVYIGDYSRKYHTKDCRRLQGKVKRVTRAKAEKWDYKPCKACKP